MDESVERAKSLILSGGFHQHVVVNAAKLVASHDDHVLRATINACSIVNADGQSVVWASKFLGDPLPERVAGIDFMDRLVQESANEGLSIYLLGAKQKVVEEVALRFRQRGANVVGLSDGYWRKSGYTDSDVVRRIASLRPNILFVAIPSPLKEEFLAANITDLKANLCVGVGGSFDVVAGETRRAPLLLQKIGMEWFFRLVQEPRRMFIRYLVGNSRFVLLTIASVLRPDLPRGENDRKLR
jgi:N-acetylglucosaminyldiphosphoundecaprenol N-acetyl-beta-D-mannosaminyltransferase